MTPGKPRVRRSRLTGGLLRRMSANPGRRIPYVLAEQRPAA